MSTNPTPTLDALLRGAATRIDATDARWLLAHAVERPQGWLYAHARDPAPAGVAERFDTLVARRAAGEPVAYITGVQGFGFFATIPTPHIPESVAETARALDHLRADGVVLLANSAGTYLGQPGQDALFAALNERSAVVFIHPADLPGPVVEGVAPFATDFLLDTTRAAYLLVRNGIRRKYPNIKFILGHAGGFVPYASHRMAVAIMADTGRSPADATRHRRVYHLQTLVRRFLRHRH